MRLSQAARKFNISTATIAQYLTQKGHSVDSSPHTKLTVPQLTLITQEFGSPSLGAPKAVQSSSKPIKEQKTSSEPSKESKAIQPPTALSNSPQPSFRVLGSIALPSKNLSSKFMQVTSSDQLSKVSRPLPKKKPAPAPKAPPKKRSYHSAPSKDFKARRKYRKEKKTQLLEQEIHSQYQREHQEKRLQVTPFITAKEFAGLLKKPIKELLATCLELGRPTSMNQRLDEDTLLFLGEHYGYTIAFITLEEESEKHQPTIDPINLLPRAPIVTVMGHVDHGKTSFLDYIRETSITKQEAGGITQHIGASEVHTAQGKRIVFLDTPGHEAFTAMRARGSQITDIVIIIIAADEQVMPQTKEAIRHAQIAGLPMVIAINKIDKVGADPDRIKGQLTDLNITVEELGGTYQCQHISAKTGEGIPELLEKVLLEADLLTLQADPIQPAQGTVIEASLDRGKGYLTNLMVQQGTLKRGDILLAGSYFGKVKAILDSQGGPLTTAPPATPVQILGLNGAPKAGESFKVASSEKRARELASRYQAIRKQQTDQAQKRIIKSLEDIIDPLQGAQQLNLIIKADFDGSAEALADSLLPLSTEEVKVHIIHQAVGPILESDVLLAATSNAQIIGFHTKVNKQVQKIATQEKVPVHLHNLIHEAKEAVEGLIRHLSGPSTEEVMHGQGILIQIFRVKGIGTIGGCRVQKGFIKKSSQVRILRESEILYQGAIKSLKIESEDVKEAKEGFNCGINLRNFDNLQVGDQVEAFEVREV